MKPKAVLAYCREKGIRAVDLRFPDLGGRWKHVTFPVSALTENAFETGFGQELTLRGRSPEAREQMVLIPMSNANYLDPLLEQPTLVILATVQDAWTRIESWMDSRAVTGRASEYLRATGIADEAVVRSCQAFSLERNGSTSTKWEGPPSQAFLSCGPLDFDFSFRCELASSAAEAGVNIERHYRGETATSEIVLGGLRLLECCDDLMMIRYMIEQMVAKQGVRLETHGLTTATQWSLIRSGEEIFGSGLHPNSHFGLSEVGWNAMGGILQHARTLAAIAMAAPRLPSTERYEWRSIVSENDPRAICNVLFGSQNPKSRTIEYRGLPARSNPYLHLAAVLMAMIDGIQNKTPVPKRSESVHAESEQASHRITVEESGSQVRELFIEALTIDRDFLLAGSVFPEALLDWISDSLRE